MKKAMWSAFDNSLFEYGIGMYRSFAAFHPDIPMYFADFEGLSDKNIAQLESIGVNILRRPEEKAWIPQLRNGVDLLASEFFTGDEFDKLLWLDADTIVADDVSEVFDYDEDYVGMGPTNPSPTEPAFDEHGNPIFPFGFWQTKSLNLLYALNEWIRNNHHLISRERDGATRVIHENGFTSRQLDLNVYSFGKGNIKKAEYDGNRLFYRAWGEKVFPKLIHLNRIGAKRFESNAVKSWYIDHIDNTEEKKSQSEYILHGCFLKKRRRGIDKKVLVTVGDGIGNQIQSAPAVACALRNYGNIAVYNPEEENMAFTELMWKHLIVWNPRLKDYDGQIEMMLRHGHRANGIPSLNAKSSVFNEVLWNLQAVGASFSEEDVENSRDFLSWVEVADSPDILIHNGYKKPEWFLDRWLAKSYPYYAEVVDKLKNKGFSVGCIGGSDEKVDGAENLTNRSFYDLVSLIKGCRVLIANDTCGYHIAGLLNVPCVAVFTFTSLKKNYHPEFHKSVDIVRREDLKCSPCQKMGQTKPEITHKRRPFCGWKCREVPVERVVNTALDNIGDKK